MSKGNVDTALVKLSGTKEMTDGSTESHSLFDFLDVKLDDYSEVSYTPEEARRIKTHLTHLVTGAAAAVPLHCGGPARCPFADSCPFVKEDRRRKAENPEAKMITPLGKRCLVEVNLLAEWTKLYIHEFDIDPKNLSEFGLVRDLAETELLLWRLNNNLSKIQYAELVQEAVVGVDREGNPLTRLEVNAFMEAKDRLLNRKMRLIKSMVGDPEGKYKREAALKITAKDDPSTNSAKLRSDLTRAIAGVKELDKKLKEAEGNIIEAKCVERETPDTVESTPLTPEDLINGEG